jgi:1-acyl-sn-glycerol-3-phosphate acyltransferase
LLRVAGWRIEGQVPTAPKYVLIAAPHTSNWDFVWAMSMAVVLRVKLNWFAKHTLFKPMVGALFRRWGGIPIRRDERANRVEVITEQLRLADSMVVLIPAEGTRSYTEHWKSGFYHIAQAARVPIVLGYLDYAERRGGFGPLLMPGGELVGDMQQIRSFYSALAGKYPADVGPVRLKEEAA